MRFSATAPTIPLTPTGACCCPSSCTYEFAARLLRAWFTLIVLLLWTGCHQPVPGPPIPRSDPGLEAQVRVLREAQAAHAQGRYPAAVRLLTRFISTYPQSTRLPEARWQLGQAYERSGNLKAALAEYRTLAAGLSVAGAASNSYESQAVRHLDELRQRPVQESAPAKTHLALFLPSQMTATADLESWIDRLAKIGITTLALQIGTGTAPLPLEPNATPSSAARSLNKAAGVYFQTTRAFMVEDRFRPLVRVAHRAGLSVFAVIDLQQMAWLSVPSEWTTMVYQPSTRQVQPSSSLDFFNPVFQNYLLGLLTDLAHTGVDGIIVRMRMKEGASLEVSAASLRGFETSGGVRLEPVELFAGMPQDQRGGHWPGERNPSASIAGVERYFWQWVGWKSRERLRLFERIREQLTKQGSTVNMVIEMHPEVITSPLHALLEHGEDLLEARHMGFDIMLHLPQAFTESLSPSQSNGGGTLSDEDALLRRAIELFGGPAEQLWVTAQLQNDNWSGPVGLLLSPSDQARHASGIHVLLHPKVERSVP